MGFDPLMNGYSTAGIWTRQLLLHFKIASILWLFLMLLMLCIPIVSNASVTSEIYTPPQRVLPGSPLPRFAGEDACDKFAPVNMICGELDGQKIYWSYESKTQKIVRTIILAAEYTIGDLILAWGTPTGFDRYGTAIFVSWEARSAHLMTDFFHPYSPIRFIQYDLEPPQRSVWRGFGRS